MRRDTRTNRKTLGLTVTAVLTIALKSSAATHYVSQTSPNPTSPFSTLDTAAHAIQEAVDVASDGDTVSVAPGDYGLTNQVTITNGILLQGVGGANQTFLSGLSNIWCLRISNSLAVVDGFTLRDPYPFDVPQPTGAFLVGGTIQNCAFTNFYIGPQGGAIVMSGGVVSNSIVTYRRYPPSYGAAAVTCSDEGLITDCLVLGIQNPGHGGGVALTNSELRNSVISGVGGSTQDGGVALSAFTSSIVGCTISNNLNIATGGGVHLEDSVMDRCVVTHNTGGGECSGGGGIFEINSVIRDSLITSNFLTFSSAEPGCGSYGGGVFMRGGALVNCTVVGNTARYISNGTGGGGGVYAESGGVTNCIIYFNWPNFTSTDSSSNWLSTGTAFFDHCCTTPDPGGSGTITQDPQFADMTNGNYHLSNSSPCIGTGLVHPWMADAQDLDGNPRTTNGRVDMGAYQSGSPPLTSKLSIFRSGTNVVVQWRSGQPGDLVLESSSDLSAPESWTSVQAPAYSDGTNVFVTLPATNQVQFFRRR